MREEAMRRAAWYHEVRQAQQAHHEELCKTRREELERRTREKTKEREAKQEAKKVQEAETRRAQKEAFDQESRAQRARWQREGAVTGEDKVKSCLHSDFCTKIPQQKKFKCGECRYKRGMTAFACPHCALWLCQLCLTKFAERRARDGKSKPAQQQPATFKQ
jgi:hypothetical protein